MNLALLFKVLALAAVLAAAGMMTAAMAQQPGAPAPATASKPASRSGFRSTTTPVVRGGRHQQFLQIAAKGDVDLVFYGDSITQGWNNNEVWRKYYKPRKAANFGISGERTEHILWGIQNGEVENIKPKVVVVMIGTNNTGGDSAEAIADGITLIVKTLRQKLPESKVLLVGIFPRGEKTDARRAKIAQINQTIAKLDDGTNVRYLDFGGKFLDAEGNLPADVMPDKLHLSAKGYQIWANAMEPLLSELMGPIPATAPAAE